MALFKISQNTLVMIKTPSYNPSLREVFAKTDLGGKTSLILSTWFFSGLLPLAPGTFGTLCAVPLVLVLSYLDIKARALLLVILIIVAVWCSAKSQKQMGRKDPPEVVIDEVAGYSLTMFLLPLTIPSLFLGFVFFRLFDIVKPFPVKSIESRLRGGIGIVGDDLMAGLYAFGITKALLMLFQ